MKFLKIFLIAFVIHEITSLMPETELGKAREEEREIEKEEHPYGAPLGVVHFDGNNGVIVDHDVINALKNPLLEDRKVVIYSIVGEFRKGKSFLMDYALRYLYAHYKSVSYMDNPLNNKAGWMGRADEPLKGFSWEGGKDAKTKGVVIWSDIFLHEQNGKKLGIIVMDTQGLFDNESRTIDSMRIFALNALLSSFLMYNVGGQVKETELEYLHLATEYAKLVNVLSKDGSGSEGVKPFQDFTFLIRDWPHERNHNLGLKGGNDYVKDLLLIKRNQHKELKDVRRNIQNSFDNTYGFLMPHPGKNVTTDEDFKGEHGMLPNEFKDSIKEFVEWSFAPEQLKIKRVFGQELEIPTYLEYVKSYCKTFKSTKLPLVKNIYAVTIEQQFTTYNAECMEYYKHNITALATAEHLSRDDFEEVLDQKHNQAKSAALKIFDDKKKLGSAEDEKHYRDILVDTIDGFYRNFTTNVRDNVEKYKALNKQLAKEMAENAAAREEMTNAMSNLEKNLTLAMEELSNTESIYESRLANLTAENKKNLTELNSNLTRAEQAVSLREQQLKKYYENLFAERESNYTKKMEKEKENWHGTISELQAKMKKLEQEKKNANQNDQKAYNSGLDQFKILHDQMKAEHNASLTLILSNMQNQQQMYEQQRKHDKEIALMHKQNFERELAEKKTRLEETRIHYQSMMQQQQLQHRAYIEAIRKNGSTSLKAANALLALVVLIGFIKFMKM